MIYLYDDYRGADRWISMEECLKLQAEMAAEIGTDPDAMELYDDLISACIDYADLRAAWTIHDNDWRSAKDRTRTIYHDGVISSMNTLATYLRKIQGKKAEWRSILGENEKGPDRKRVGDFACFLVYIQGINGR